MVDFARMPKSFAELAERCRTTVSTGTNISEPYHLLERTFLVGEGEFRIYLILNRVSSAKGVHWFGFIMAPVAGDLNNDVIPYRDWGADRNLHACKLREWLLGLEPGFVEAVEKNGDGLTFRGPFTKG